MGLLFLILIFLVLIYYYFKARGLFILFIFISLTIFFLYVFFKKNCENNITAIPENTLLYVSFLSPEMIIFNHHKNEMDTLKKVSIQIKKIYVRWEKDNYSYWYVYLNDIESNIHPNGLMSNSELLNNDFEIISLKWNNLALFERNNKQQKFFIFTKEMFNASMNNDFFLIIEFDNIFDYSTNPRLGRCFARLIKYRLIFKVDSYAEDGLFLKQVIFKP